MKSRRVAAGVVWRGAFHVLGGLAGPKPEDALGDFWRWSGGWEKLDQGPPALRGASLCQSPDAIYLFGGCGHEDGAKKFHNAVWRYDGTWEKICEGGPHPRYLSALGWFNDKLVTYGGAYQSPERENTYFGDVWVLDLKEGRWREAGQSEARYGFAHATLGNRMCVFGGFDGEQSFGDLRELDLGTLEWSDGFSIEPRHCAMLGLIRGKPVLFGGEAGPRSNDYLAGTVSFDTRVSVTSYATSPRPRAKAAYGSDGESFYIFGGQNETGLLNDLWRFDAAWTQLS